MLPDMRIFFQLEVKPFRQRFRFIPRKISAQIVFDLADMLSFTERLRRLEPLGRGLFEYRRRHENNSLPIKMHIALIQLL